MAGGDKKTHNEIELDDFDTKEKEREEGVSEEERRHEQERRNEYLHRTALQMELIASIEKQVSKFESELRATESQADAIDAALDDRLHTTQVVDALTIGLSGDQRKFYSDRINRAYDLLEQAGASGHRSLGKKFKEWGSVIAAIVGTGAGIGSLVATFVLNNRNAKSSAHQQKIMQLLQDELSLTPEEASNIKKLADELVSLRPSEFCNVVSLNVVTLKWSWASQYALTTIIGSTPPTYEADGKTTLYPVNDILALERYVCSRFNDTGKYQTIWLELNQWLLGRKTNDATVDAIPGDKSKLTLQQLMFLVEGILVTLRDAWKKNPETLPTDPNTQVGV